MPDRRRARTSGSRAGAPRTTTQTTLKNLFQRTHPEGSTKKPQDAHAERTDPMAPLPQIVDVAQLPGPSKPRQLFPIFTKTPSRGRGAVLAVDDIDIVNTGTDAELATEPAHPTRSESSHSLTPPPTAQGDPGPSRVDTREHGSANIKNSSKRSVDVVPLPSACSQHVRGVQRSYACGQVPPKRSIFPNLRAPDEGRPDFLARWRQLDDTPSTPPIRICRSLTSQQSKEYLHSLSRDYTESYPTFAYISAHQERMPLRHTETWTRHFRPRRANEVLGNERHAFYLRDWLRALEVRFRDCLPEEKAPQGRENKGKGASRQVPRGVKRPRVIRAVARKRGSKKRRVDSDDDWGDFVVLSDVDEGPSEDRGEDSEDELTFCQRTLERLRGRDTTDGDEAHADGLNGPATATNHAASRSQEAVHANFADKLTNTLLITGPPGCGKTAAVYACAEELGWQVFEVYPGIGRRSGAALEYLVGDVGKNHLVQTVHKRAATETTGPLGVDGMGRGERRRFTEISNLAGSGTEGQPICVEDGGPTDRVASGRETGGPIVGQSLVLLEEVDVLFKEDAGFWPAVVALIRDCQRPVVMTCNDAGLVPVAELPLQTVLVFEPCPSRVAATFLQCVSLSEGWHVPHDDLVALYESTPCLDAGTEMLRLPDLRRSLMQLQMLCAGGTAETQEGDRAISAGCRDTGDGEMWRQMKRESEVMSHVDAQRCRRWVGTGEGLEGEGDEEETGHVVLRDELIEEEAVEEARGAHAETGPMAASISEAFRARVAYQTRMVDALQGLVEPAGGLVPRRSVFLDYVPWVRYMAAVEDGEAGETAGAGGRRTRNSRGVRCVRAARAEVRRGVLLAGLGGENLLPGKDVAKRI